MKPLFLTKIALLLVFSAIMAIAPLATAKESFTIAYVPGKRNSFYQSVEKGIYKKAKEYNAKVIVQGYPENWAAEEQIKIIHAVFAAGSPQLLIISPAAGEVMRETLKSLHKQGVQIITIDRELKQDNSNNEGTNRFPLLHIATDQWEGGMAMATRIANLIDNKGTVYINSTFPDIPSISQRFKAFLQSLESFPNISIVGIDIAGIDFSNSDKGVVGSSSELERNAHKQSLEIIQKHPDIKAIFCTNELSGKGIIQTMLETGLEGSVKIGVWDTSREMMNAINAGIVDLALAQKPEEMGVAAVFWGNRYLEASETIPSHVKIDFQIVTKANAAEPEIQKLVYE